MRPESHNQSLEYLEQSQNEGKTERGENYRVEVKRRFLTDEELRERGVKDRKPIDISLRTKQGEEIKLQSLLPPDWIFLQEDTIKDGKDLWANDKFKHIVLPRVRLIPRFRASEFDSKIKTKDSKTSGEGILKKIAFERHEFFKMKGSLLGLMHEIGHSLQPQKDIIDHIVRNMLAKKARNENWRDVEIEHFLEKVLSSERDAWAFALRKYRDYLSQGINLEPNMTMDEIFDYVKDCLGTYGSNLPYDRDEVDRLYRENRKA